jgi:hypothetical protein
MRWDAFNETCPQIAELAEARFRADELVLLGTIRADGSARISPCEVDFAIDRLFLGMMWHSKKALDLQRDPRIVVHSVPSDRMNPGGDVKLYGRVVDERDSDVRAAFRETILARIDWAPDEPEYHLFSLDVEEAAYTVFGEGSHALAWTPGSGLRRLDLH